MNVWGVSYVLCCALRWWQLKNTWVFSHVTSQLVHPSPHKKEIYRHINLVYLISMVIVPFTISAWFLWCTDFSIPKVDCHPLTGKTYAKSHWMGFPSSIQKPQVPAKKNPTTTKNNNTINTQVNTWILCHYFDVGEQKGMGLVKRTCDLFRTII